MKPEKSSYVPMKAKEVPDSLKWEKFNNNT